VVAENVSVLASVKVPLTCVLPVAFSPNPLAATEP
jgi:hypothetical protein